VTWEQVVEFLQGAGLAHLATVSSEGWPHVSVVSPAVEGDRLWIATRTGSAKARNIAVNPRAALVWQPRAEIYLWAMAAVVADEAEKRRLWGSGVFAFDLSATFGSPGDPGHVFIRVEPVSALVLSQGPGGLTRQRWPQRPNGNGAPPAA
jgi:general stress protein 26